MAMATNFPRYRSRPPEMFLGKGILKICRKFTEHPYRSAISIKLQSNFIETALLFGIFSRKKCLFG